MKFRLFITLGLVLSVALGIFSAGSVHAVTASDWRAGNIITDGIFYDNTSMSVSDIQNYLNQKVPSCDTNGTQSAASLGYQNLTHAQYAQQIKGWPGPPYVCLKDYYQVPRSDTIVDNFSGSIPAGAISAAQIIKNAADTYSVSPKTLIVLLTKESPGPLTLDTWPLKNQYKNAMGYACPDTAPCDPAYAGFYNQVSNAAKRIQSYKQYATSYRHQPFQTNSVYYNPDLTGCGSSSVYIEGYATAGLYNYTPYQPNQAALNNLYGEGDGCSAYGNRNFWRIWNDWFGTTKYDIRGGIAEEYEVAGGYSRLGNPLMNESCGLRDGGCYQEFERGVIYWNPTQNAAKTVLGGIRMKWNSLGKEWSDLGYPISDEIYQANSVIQKFQNGIIYYSPNGAYEILNMIQNYDAVGAPVMDTACGLVSGGCYQFFTGGTMYWSPSTGSYPVLGGIKARWDTIGKEWGLAGYPTSGEIYGPSFVRQQFQNGELIYFYSNSKTYFAATQMHYSSDFSWLGTLRGDTICGLRDGGCYQALENGKYLYSSPASGSHPVFGGILEKWSQLRKEWGSLGYPTSSEYYESNGRISQDFQGGTIHWLPSGTSVEYK